MKNYLVKSLFKVRDTNWHFKDRSNETDLYEKYYQMHLISVDSFKNNLDGNWELKFIEGEVSNINDAFKTTFLEIYKLWQSDKNVNIFYTDPDTVAIRKINPWQISTRFMMFNFTDPKSFDTPNIYNRKFPYFFNAGVRFFPGEMSQKIWDIGLSMLEKWEENTYNTEQIILNSMLWDQGVTLDQVLRPEWAYQAQWLPNQFPLYIQDMWNGIDINKSFIIHTHSSRNIDEKLSFMKAITNRT